MEFKWIERNVIHTTGMFNQLIFDMQIYLIVLAYILKASTNYLIVPLLPAYIPNLI